MKKFVQIIVLLIVSMLLTQCDQQTASKNDSLTFYVGTYTKGDSEGIYRYVLDKDGVLLQKKLVAKAENPSFLTYTKNKKFLVAVNEIDHEGQGKVSSFAIEEDSLLFASSIGSGGAHPCYVRVDGDLVYIANYSGGNLSVSSINSNNGELSFLDLEQHEGKGTTSRQEAPHVHSVWKNPRYDEIISIDLGTNELWFSSFNSKTQKLEATSQKKLLMDEGGGPRHGVFHPMKSDWFYVFNELNSTITLVERNAEGIYQKKSSVSTLPDDFSEDSFGADIHISSDGQFLYASNRGHNSIAIFQVNQTDGSLAAIGHEAVQGIWPRNFALSPDDSHLLVANQFSNNIVVFQRNSETGLLSYANQVAAPNPVCILF